MTCYLREITKRRSETGGPRLWQGRKKPLKSKIRASFFRNFLEKFEFICFSYQNTFPIDFLVKVLILTPPREK